MDKYYFDFWEKALSDGPPGVKVVWIGITNLQLLLAYREWV
jgi:hypothetical protein